LILTMVFRVGRARKDMPHTSNEDAPEALLAGKTTDVEDDLELEPPAFVAGKDEDDAETNHTDDDVSELSFHEDFEQVLDPAGLASAEKKRMRFPWARRTKSSIPKEEGQAGEPGSDNAHAEAKVEEETKPEEDAVMIEDEPKLQSEEPIVDGEPQVEEETEVHQVAKVGLFARFRKSKGEAQEEPQSEEPHVDDELLDEEPEAEEAQVEEAHAVEAEAGEEAQAEVPEVHQVAKAGLFARFRKSKREEKNETEKLVAELMEQGELLGEECVEEEESQESSVENQDVDAEVAEDEVDATAEQNDSDRELVFDVSMWRSAKDPVSGYHYYYHRIERKSTWSMPPGFDVPEQEDKQVEV
jgi:hypothetical protein